MEAKGRAGRFAPLAITRMRSGAQAKTAAIRALENSLTVMIRAA